MFSLIALYFEYRKARVARATSAARPASSANDGGSNRAVAIAA
ncbi:hypothetical protein [Sphingomonas aurantiaca]|nr:hypothetical protein [Sphingomonas aurantiaca]